MRQNSTRTIRAILLAALMATSVVAGVAAFGGTVAAQDGDSTLTVGDGTGEYSSIENAIANASDGDTVLIVDSGTYGGFLLEKSLTVTAAAGVDATVDASEGMGSNGRVIDVRDASTSADGATISNLTVDATGQPSYVVGVSVSADGVTVRNVEVLGDENVTGIQTQTGYDGPGAENVRILGNTIEGANVGVSIQGANNNATDNVVTGAILEGIGVAGEGHTFKLNDVSTTGDVPGIRVYGTVSSVNGVSGEQEQAVELLSSNPDVSTVAFANSATSYGWTVENVDTGTFYVTIQDAVDAASSGDTIEVGPGRYDESVSIATENVTLKAAGDATIERGVTLSADGTDVIGFTIEAADFHGVSQPVSIYVPPSSGDHRIEDNVLVGPGSETISRGILFATGAPGDSYVAGNDVSGFLTGAYLGPAENVTLEGNEFNDNFAGVGGLEGADVTINDNAFAGNTEGLGIGTVTGLEVSGNTFVDNDRHVKNYTASNVDVGAVFEENTFETAAYVTGGQTIESDIQSVLDDAEDGDTVMLTAGTFTPSDDLDFTTPNVTFVGAGQGVTVVDASGLSHYGFDVRADDVTFEGFTLYGPANVDDDDEWDNFGMHIGNGNENISAAVRDVTIRGSALTELDLISVKGVLIENVTVDGEDTAGSGIGLSDAHDVTVRDVAVRNNNWGGIAIMTNGQYNLPASTSNVTVTGDNTFDNPAAPVYLDPMHDGRENITDLHLDGFDYEATAGDYRDGDFAWYFRSEGNATAFAEALVEDDFDGETPNHPVVRNVETGVFSVSDATTLRTAVENADDGDTIELSAGEYNLTHTLTIRTDNLTIRGGDGVVIDTSAVAGYGISTAEGQNVAGLTVENLTVVGSDASYTFKFNPTTEDVTIRNVDVDSSHKTGIDFNGVDGVLIEDVTVSGTASGNGIALADTRNVVIDGATVENNAWGGIALYTNDDAGVQGTHNVTITGSAIRNNGGPGVYAQNSGGADTPFANITVAGNEFAGNQVHVAELTTENGIKEDAEWFDLGAVLNGNDFDRTTKVDNGDENWEAAIFGAIQPAVDIAENGDTVYVGNGEFEENVVIDSSITLDGDGTGDTVIAPANGRPISVENLVDGDRIKIDTVTVTDLTLRASDGSIGLITVSNTDGDYETGTLTVEDVVVEGGVSSFGLFDTEKGTFENVVVRDVEGDAGAFEVGGVGELTIVDSRIEDTTTGVKLNDFTGLGYEETGTLTITGTTFASTDTAVNVTAGIDATSVTLTDNVFLNEGQSTEDAVAVENGADGPVNATHNYWGAPSGPSSPSGEFSGTGAAVSENVTVEPFYVGKSRQTLSKTVNRSTVENDTATVPLTGGNAKSVRVSLPSGTTATSVTVTEAEAPTGDATDPGRNVATYLDIDAGEEIDGNVSISVTVELNTLQNKSIDPDDAVILHFTDGNWTELETVATVDGDQVTLEATSDGLSPFAVAQRDVTDDEDDSDGRSGSRRSDGSVDAPPNRVSTTLLGGQAHARVSGLVSKVSVYFADGGTGGEVTVEALDARPDSVPAIPNANGFAYVDVSVPDGFENSEASLRLTVDADAVGDVDASDLVVYHYHGGEWSTLETSVVSESGGEVVLEATTPGFSVFAVGAADEGDTTPDDGPDDQPTDEPADEPTDAPADEPTDAGNDAPADSTDEPADELGGFNVGLMLGLLLLVAIVAAAAFVRIRRE